GVHRMISLCGLGGLLHLLFEAGLGSALVRSKWRRRVLVSRASGKACADPRNQADGSKVSHVVAPLVCVQVAGYRSLNAGKATACDNVAVPSFSEPDVGAHAFHAATAFRNSVSRSFQAGAGITSCAISFLSSL